MCQGAILSLVQFPVKGKTKTVILRGVGSHSDMFERDKDRLAKLGAYKSHAMEQEKIISVESNFIHGWGKFTVESGMRDVTPKIYAKLEKEFEKCTGSFPKLLKHLSKYGWHSSLWDLLTEEAVRLADKLGYFDYPSGEFDPKLTIKRWASMMRLKENRILSLR